MLEFLSKQIPYNYNFKRQLAIGAFLGAILTFIMIFLQPFGTYAFESNNKYLIFFGFGQLFFILYFFWARIENTWYNRKNKKWEVKNELVSFLFFVIVSALPIHFYNQVFLNNLFDSTFEGVAYMKHGLWFFKSSVVPIMLILFPFYVYLRNRFGELIPPEIVNEITLFGSNKDEKITLNKEELLFVQASENYVDIYYKKDDGVEHKTFRNTLAAVKKQAPFLYKSHRSYLVNTSAIKTVSGHSQNAKIALHHEGLEVPLSKSYYKTIKLAMGS